MIEEWKDIKGYEGHYQVSNMGRIKSLPRTVQWTVKEGQQTRRGFMLKPSTDKGGYKVVTLTLRRKRNNFTVHRLVGKTFIPNPENKPEINHKDGDPGNNKLSNLEWVTSQENSQHSWDFLGRVNPRNIPIRCVTHDFETISIREMGRELARKGLANEQSHRTLSYHQNKGREKFKYKGMEFEMIDGE